MATKYNASRKMGPCRVLLYTLSSFFFFFFFCRSLVALSTAALYNSLIGTPIPFTNSFHSLGIFFSANFSCGEHFALLSTCSSLFHRSV